mgnify:CR=1 FL=1
MVSKNKKLILFQRLIIWTIYLFSGLILYTKKGNLYPFLIQFTKITYPLSIFWLQIRIKKKNNLLNINSSMTTSQLWFNILPVIASFFAVIFSILNLIFYFFGK